MQVDGFDTYLARVLCSIPPATLRLYGPLSVKDALTAIGRRVMYEEHRLAFVHCYTLLPEHGGVYARFRARRARVPAAARMCYANDAPVLSTDPLPDPSAGIDLPDMIDLAYAAAHALAAAIDPHGPDCTDGECMEQRGACEIPAMGPHFNLAGVAKLDDGTWCLQWGNYYA